MGRRTIVKGGAWAVPVVSMAASLPSVPLSGPCLPFDLGLVWTGAGYTRANSYSASYVRPFQNPVTGQNDQVTVTLAAVFRGTMEPGSEFSGTNYQLRVTNYNIGGTGAPGIEMHQHTSSRASTESQRRANRQELTFSFDRPVYDLSFGITDIDSVNGDYWDQVELYSDSAWTSTNGTNVDGSGTQAAPWGNTSANSPQPEASGDGNANITFTEPVTSFTIYYWDNREFTGIGIDNDQAIFITNLDFKVSGCDWNP